MNDDALELREHGLHAIPDEAREILARGVLQTLDLEVAVMLGQLQIGVAAQDLRARLGADTGRQPGGNRADAAPMSGLGPTERRMIEAIAPEPAADALTNNSPMLLKPRPAQAG